MNPLQARNEIRVWCRRHHNRTIWYAYDPNNNDTLSFKTEAQLRDWLDNFDRGESPHSVRLWNGAGQNTNPLHINQSVFAAPVPTHFAEKLR